jgi:hypothetical protein
MDKKPQVLTFQSDGQVDCILELHLVDPHGRVIPLSVVLVYILTDAGAQLFNKAQRRVVRDFQVGSFPPNHSLAYCSGRRDCNTH